MSDRVPNEDRTPAPVEPLDAPAAARSSNGARRRAAARARDERHGRGQNPPDGADSGHDFPTGDAIDVRDPKLYLNRELSLLEFNARVLHQALDESAPLLERLRFLTICSTNLDEFFEIRVAGLKQMLELGIDEGAMGRTRAREVLKRIATRAHELVTEQYRVLNEQLLPELESEGIKIVFRAEWDDATRAWANAYFEREVMPVLTPVGLDPAHPFPLVQNKSLNFMVSLDGRDAFGRSSRLAIVQAPRLLPRLIPVPEEVAGGEHHFVTLSGVIHTNVGRLFPGMSVAGCYPFRVTRNSDLWVDEEEAEDLLRALKGELKRRPYGDEVRIEVNDECPESICEFLLHQFDLEEGDLYRVNGPVNLHRLAVLHDLVDRADLKYAPFVPALPPRFSSQSSAFELLRQRDVLLHHPFQSFTPVVELLKEAARDPDVLAIKITLYRTGTTSPLTDALLDAARNGKEVTAVVELRARFDEEANIDIATRLQEAGVRVVYGIVGYKAHCKMLLVVRREHGRLRRYVHLGTGNYHPKTTSLYTDFGLMTCSDELGADVHTLFQQLTGLGRADRLEKLVQSPFNLYRRIVALIENERRAAEQGRPAAIKAKMNALTEPTVIEALYRASQAGVPIDLIVRGACCLRPGVPGVSETIRVRSIVGRFLEHSRIFHFHADGEGLTYCASADWMPRNLFRRVETAFPIEDDALRARVVSEGLDVYLQDNVRAWELQSDGEWARLERGDAPAISAQDALLETLAKKAP